VIAKKILVCTDFSDNSRPALELAAEYARAFGAELIIFHAIDNFLAIDYTDFPDHVDWSAKLQEILGHTQRAAEARLELIAKEYASEVRDVKTFCRKGMASDGIIALAQKESVDLIVVGTHGRTGVKHLVMGSVARSVLKRAHRPVLIVEGPSDKEESSEASH
jgi:universal stress protein A